MQASCFDTVPGFKHEATTCRLQRAVPRVMNQFVSTVYVSGGGTLVAIDSTSCPDKQHANKAGRCIQTCNR